MSGEFVHSTSAPNVVASTASRIPPASTSMTTQGSPVPATSSASISQPADAPLFPVEEPPVVTGSGQPEHPLPAPHFSRSHSDLATVRLVRIASGSTSKSLTTNRRFTMTNHRTSKDTPPSTKAATGENHPPPEDQDDVRSPLKSRIVAAPSAAGTSEIGYSLDGNSASSRVPLQASTSSPTAGLLPAVVVATAVPVTAAPPDTTGSITAEDDDPIKGGRPPVAQRLIVVAYVLVGLLVVSALMWTSSWVVRTKLIPFFIAVNGGGAPVNGNTTIPVVQNGTTAAPRAHRNFHNDPRVIFVVFLACLLTVLPLPGIHTLACVASGHTLGFINGCLVAVPTMVTGMVLLFELCRHLGRRPICNYFKEKYPVWFAVLSQPQPSSSEVAEDASVGQGRDDPSIEGGNCFQRLRRCGRRGLFRLKSNFTLPVRTVILLRLAPLPFAVQTMMWATASGLHVWTFLWATSIIVVPQIILNALLGSVIKDFTGWVHRGVSFWQIFFLVCGIVLLFAVWHYIASQVRVALDKQKQRIADNQQQQQQQQELQGAGIVAIPPPFEREANRGIRVPSS